MGDPKGGEQDERFVAMYFTDKSIATEFTKRQRERPALEWEQFSQRIVAWLNKLVPMTRELKNKLKLRRRMPDTVPIGLWEFRRRRWYKEGSAQKLNAILLQKRPHVFIG